MDAYWTRARLGAWLREVRQSAGLTSPQLAELSGIDLGRISRVENGKASLRVDQIEQFVEACHRRLVLRADHPDERGDLADVIGQLDRAQVADVETFARAIRSMSPDVRAMLVREARGWADEPKLRGTIPE